MISCTAAVFVYYNSGNKEIADVSVQLKLQGSISLTSNSQGQFYISTEVAITHAVNAGQQVLLFSCGLSEMDDFACCSGTCDHQDPTINM